MIFFNKIIFLCSIFISSIYCLPDPVNIIKKNGYPAEKHLIETQDGYILTVHRIPHGINNSLALNNNENRPVVLINHGMGSSSADFVNLGPGRSLGYILADLGYDVWMANSRGNSYSTKHKTINQFFHPDVFYNFSWHEMGKYDIPAEIDYILNKTNENDLYYIGHSQGCTAFYVFASTYPELQDKIRLASLMGPAGLMKNSPDEILKILSDHIYELEDLSKQLKLYHIPMIGVVRTFIRNFCLNPNNTDLCYMAYSIFGGGYSDRNETDTTLFPILFQTTPSDMAIKSALHYGQGIKSGKFREYNYGKDRNKIQYGTEEPPEYDFGKINVSVALYYGKNDRFVRVEDVHLMSHLIPNVVNNYLIPYEKFNHGDFLFARDVVSMVYDELIKTMKKY